MTFIAHTHRKETHENLGLTLYQIIGSSLLIALCSQIKFVLPFTPIPITFQTLAVLLVGATLGSRKAFYAIGCYYAEILVGLPVLAGGLANPLIFFGPKGGYYLGFCVQAFIMGWFVEKAPFSKSVNLLAGGLLACAAQMAMGLFVFAQFVGWSFALPMGLYPFIPSEILKVFAVSFCLTSSKEIGK